MGQTRGMGGWQIDRGVAQDLGGFLGWRSGDGPEALVAALGARLPAGSTAKLDAVRRGAIPPGADPELLARQILGDVEAGRPMWAWSCWVYATLFAALVETADIATADVVATRRFDDRSPLVDFHSAVLVDDGTTTILSDPFFVAVLPGPGAAETEAVHQGVWARRTDEAHGSWSYIVGSGRWVQRLQYRRFSVALSNDDVRALCAISVTFSGVPAVPTARLWRTDEVVEASVRDPESTPGPPRAVARLQTWRWSAPGDPWRGHHHETDHDSWAQAVDAFTARTGVTLRL